MRSLKSFTCRIVGSTAVALFFLPLTLPAEAETLIRGEFEYNVDQQTLSEWAIGPIFSLTETTELAIPIGQDKGRWKAQMELIYTLDVRDNMEIEFSVGLESLERQPIQGFGSIEASVDF